MFLWMFSTNKQKIIEKNCEKLLKKVLTRKKNSDIIAT